MLNKFINSCVYWENARDLAIFNYFSLLNSMRARIKLICFVADFNLMYVNVEGIIK